jgi:hypothetical protein
MKRFFVVDENPNGVTGGGGCACGPRELADTKGPFIVFPVTDMEDPMSPHNVVCTHCAGEALGELARGDALAGGEVVDTTAVDLDEPPPPDPPPPPPPTPEEDALRRLTDAAQREREELPEV